MLSAYENGLRTLKQEIGKHHACYGNLLVYEQRLQENIELSRRYGDTPTRTADRAQIIDELNALALSAVSTSFNDICANAVPSPSHSPQNSTASHGMASTTPNPFGTRGRIEDPAHFWGRDYLLHDIYAELSKGANMSLVGESEVGKSSILAMISAQGRQAISPPPNGCIYLDMQLIRDDNDFFEAVCDELGIPACRGHKLWRTLRRKRYILCLDEIEKMTKQSYFPGEEREELRGLAEGDTAPFKLVIASRVSLVELFPDRPGITSPLANLCQRREVGPFTPDEARNFVLHRLRGTGCTFTNAQLDDLLVRSGCHPGRLQQMAAELFRDMNHR